MFFPTLLGLVFAGLFNLADGIFVGQGVGSDALAAINVAAPIFLVTTGIALMFGSGVSVLASHFMARGRWLAARVAVTRSFACSLLLISLTVLLVMIFPESTAMLFGGSGRLIPLVVDYLLWVSPGLVFSVLLIQGLFVLRLDGAPRYAMYVEVGASLINIFLDWLFVFPLDWGIRGAAFATTLSQALGGLAVGARLLWFPRQLSLTRLRLTPRGFHGALSSCGRMMRLGFSGFVAETAVSVMLIAGNIQFYAMLREDGVAAFSVCCYLFPLVLMFANSVAQSALPIISYNHGKGSRGRVRRTIRLSSWVIIACASLVLAAALLLRRPVVSLFLAPDTAAWTLCVDGLQLFAFGFFLMSLNIVAIGFYQSLGRAVPAAVFMLLRGYLLIVPAFLFLPRWLAVPGLWLAVPVVEGVTLLAIIAARLNDCLRNPLP